MKPKYLVIFATCFMLLVGSWTFGSDVGNNPERTGWRIDFGFDHSTREVELDKPATVYFESIRTDIAADWYYIDTWSAILNSFDGQETMDKVFLNFSYGWSDRYSVYFKGGMARMKSEMFDPYFYDKYEYYEYDTGSIYNYYYIYDYVNPPLKGKGDWGPFYGAGFKAVFFESGDFRIGLDAQYNIFKMDSDVVLYQYSDMYYENILGSTYSWDYLDQHSLVETETNEYQLALVFSKKNPEFSPYGGFKLSGYETEYTGEAYYRYIDDGVLQYDYLYKWELTTKPQDFYGFFFGADWMMTEVFYLNGEIRVGDETAMTALLSWKF